MMFIILNEQHNVHVTSEYFSTIEIELKYNITTE